MIKQAHRLGAIFYMLWGLLHVAGGLLLLTSLPSAGATGVLGMMGTAVPPEQLPTLPHGVSGGVLAFHAWNIIGFGSLSLVIALLLNWQNSRLGYWLNLVIVGIADLGLIIYLLIPGYMHLSDGIWGPLLWLLAILFSTIGLWQQTRSTHPHPAFS